MKICISFLIIIFVACFVGFILSVEKKRLEAHVEQSKQFCAENGFTDFAECQAMWRTSGIK